MARPDSVTFQAWGLDGVTLDWREDKRTASDSLGRIGVRFSADGRGHVLAVQLQLGGGITPTELQRFPWGRWLAMADAAYRMTKAGDNASSLASAAAAFGEEVTAAKLGVPVSSLRPRDAAPFSVQAHQRPGRRGRPDAFYAYVAKRYTDLRATGETNPTTAIAKQHDVSRNTAAGWVRGARKRGLLLPARPGRAG